MRMISLLDNVKIFFNMIYISKFICGLFFLVSTFYISVPETYTYVYYNMVYFFIPEIIKYINTKVLKKTDSILTYRYIFLIYFQKVIELGLYGCIVSNNNIIYEMLSDKTTLPLYLWNASMELNRYKFYCDVTTSSIILSTICIFLPFFKHFYRNITIIIDNLTAIPLTTYRDIMNSINAGQSLNIEIGEIKIISIPPSTKIFITEEELEKIAPMKLPDNILENSTIDDKCAICQDSLECKKEMYRKLPKCNHSFHCHCIDNWFFSGHMLCPICRRDIK